MRVLKVPRISVTLNPGTSAPSVIARVKHIVSSIAANPATFKTPNPPTAVCNAHVSDAEAAQAAIATRALGTVEIRDAKLRIVLADLHTMALYVEETANVDVSTAPATIRAAGFDVRKAPARTKQDFTVKQGAVSGSVILVAKATAIRAAYNWQSSLDQKVWSDLSQTVESRATVTGLNVGVLYYFRVCWVTRAGKSDWSHVESLFVK